jgi:hypothetical protein
MSSLHEPVIWSPISCLGLHHDGDHDCAPSEWVLAHCQDEHTLYSRRPRKGTGVFTYLPAPSEDIYGWLPLLV